MKILIQGIDSLYQQMGLQRSAEGLDVILFLLAFFIFSLVFYRLLARKSAGPTPEKLPTEKTQAPQVEKRETPELPQVELPRPTEEVPALPRAGEEEVGVPVEEVLPPVAEKMPWILRLKKGLSRSRTEIWGKLESIMTGEKLSADQIEQIEEILYAADMGPTTVDALMTELRKNAEKDFHMSDLKNFLYQFLLSRIEGVQKTVATDLYKFHPATSGKTKVIMIVGVNGAGKTTTIGKLATRLTRQGAKVVVGACDTFRAAAVDQLEIWCQRSGATLVRAGEGADPSGVAFETLKKAKEMQADYCLLDTAGRLHTNANLMEELKKGKRVLGKLDETAPHQVMLVIDAITGQNALKQAREFHKALDLTSLIFTKCDGSAKAGNAVSIIQELQVPIAYIGVGEDVDDLNIFDMHEYLRVLLNIEQMSPV